MSKPSRGAFGHSLVSRIPGATLAIALAAAGLGTVAASQETDAEERGAVLDGLCVAREGGDRRPP
jgi:hypothetical protein